MMEQQPNLMMQQAIQQTELENKASALNKLEADQWAGLDILGGGTDEKPIQNIQKCQVGSTGDLLINAYIDSNIEIQFTCVKVLEFLTKGFRRGKMVSISRLISKVRVLMI